MLQFGHQNWNNTKDSIWQQENYSCLEDFFLNFIYWSEDQYIKSGYSKVETYALVDISMSKFHLIKDQANFLAGMNSLKGILICLTHRCVISTLCIYSATSYIFLCFTKFILVLPQLKHSRESLTSSFPISSCAPSQWAFSQ